MLELSQYIHKSIATKTPIAMVETKASKDKDLFRADPIHTIWTTPIPEFNVEKEFDKSDGPMTINLSDGVEINFSSSELEKEIPPGDIFRYDLDQEDELRSFLHPLLKKESRIIFTTPLAHIRNILLDQYYEPDGKFGLKEGGKSLFLAYNCYRIVLPIWSIQVGDKFYLNTVTEDLQDKSLTSGQKTYVEEKIVKHIDTFFYFDGLEKS